MRFIDTVIRLEHVPLNSSTGVAIEVWIQNLEYSDEAGLDPSNTSLDPDESAKGYIISAFSTKRFYMEGVTFHTDEFPSRARTFSRNMASTCSTPDSKVSVKICFTCYFSGEETILTICLFSSYDDRTRTVCLSPHKCLLRKAFCTLLQKEMLLTTRTNQTLSCSLS